MKLAATLINALRTTVEFIVTYFVIMLAPLLSGYKTLIHKLDHVLLLAHNPSSIPVIPILPSECE